MSVTAPRRPSSSSQFDITRRIDAGNRYRKGVVGAWSEYNMTDTPYVKLDESAAALAEACALRQANEAGKVCGSATIPRFTSAYRVGDKVQAIVGRNLSLRTNAGAPAGEGDVYPAVVSVTWNFDAGQSTILELSDHRGER